MKPAPIYPNEDERLKIIKEMGILDTPPDPKFDALTKEAVTKLHVPIATVTIMDKNREWYKSCQGLPNREGPRETSFCGHAMYADQIFIVSDTLKNPDFSDNPMVINPPYIRFYAGMSLKDNNSGLPVGAFCVKDTKPRDFSMEETGIFIDIATRAEKLLNE